MLHLAGQIHCPKSHLLCEKSVFLCEHIDLKGKAVHLPEHRAVLGRQTAGFQVQKRASASCTVLLLQEKHLSGLWPYLLGIQLKDHSQKKVAVISSLVKLAESFQNFLSGKNASACQFTQIKKGPFQNLFILHPLIILQGIQEDFCLVRPLIQNCCIGFEQLAFHRIVALILHICQQFLCPGTPLFQRQFSNTHHKEIFGRFQTFLLLIRSHIYLKLLPLRGHNLIGKGLVYCFNPDPAEIIPSSQILPADDIFQFIDTSDKVPVVNILFLYFQEISFYRNLRS